MTRIGVLLSGRGSNFEAIADSGIPIAVVLSNKGDAPGLLAARRRGIPAVAVAVSGRDRVSYDLALVALLLEHGVELVCLAGYMRLLSAGFIDAFRGRILNIHPSLLPAFPGLHAQRQALVAGVTTAGCTVHWVTEEMDAGPIVLQAEVPVLADDSEETLSARILHEEHRIYPEAIRAVCRDIQSSHPSSPSR